MKNFITAFLFASALFFGEGIIAQVTFDFSGQSVSGQTSFTYTETSGSTTYGIRIRTNTSAPSGAFPDFGITTFDPKDLTAPYLYGNWFIVDFDINNDGTFGDAFKLSSMRLGSLNIDEDRTVGALPDGDVSKEQTVTSTPTSIPTFTPSGSDFDNITSLTFLEQNNNAYVMTDDIVVEPPVIAPTPCTPALGTESFTNDLGTLVDGLPSPQSAILECYEFEVISSGNVTIGSDGADVRLWPDGTLTEFRIKASDGSAFQLDNFGYWNQSSNYQGDITVTGYLNGSAVSGASTTVAVQSFFSSAQVDVTSITAFDNIDEFRLSFSNSNASGLFLVREITISEAVTNSAPTDIALDNSSINQSATGVDATVGNLSTTDANAGDSHTYSLVAGTGDDDNGSFNISGSGSTLRTNSTLTPGNYSVRINTNDGTDDFAKQFTITVIDDVAPDPPSTPDLDAGSDTCASDSDNITDDTTPTFTGTAEANSTVNLISSINGNVGSIAANGTGQWSITATALDLGTHTITATATDANNNTSIASSGLSVTITTLDDASFNYTASSYCADDSDPTPTITGLSGGTFSSSGGLSINASTGVIDVSGSTPGTYTVTYTTNGTCPNSSDASVTINALDDAAFSYAASSYCADDTDPTPIVTGLSGGTFSSSGGLSINASTGVIDVSGSTPGTYTVTYTTNGTCPNSSDADVTINALDDAAFSYGQTAYCANADSPAPEITGISGGTFSVSPVGLSINPATGEIDIAASQPGNYTITYTTPGPCTNSATFELGVLPEPAISCPGPITKNTSDSGNGQCAAEVSWNNPAEANGACPPITLTIAIDDGTPQEVTESALFSTTLAVGGHTVTYTISDDNGNQDECTFNVTVQDDTAPVALCLDSSVDIGSEGQYQLQLEDVFDSAQSTDNCSIASAEFSPATFTCDEVGLTFPVPVVVTDANNNTSECTANITVASGGSLPGNWQPTDIGSQGSGSDYSYAPCATDNPNGGDFTITTGGYNLIPANADNLGFISQELCNDGGIQARIESVTGGYAGLMIRENNAPGAKMIAIYSNLSSLLRRETRTVENCPRSSSSLFASYPFWLRLRRQGDYIRAFYRTSDAGSWQLFHQAYLPMKACVEMGLAVFTTDPNGQAEATFAQVATRSNIGANNLAAVHAGTEASEHDGIRASIFPNPAQDAFSLKYHNGGGNTATAVLRNPLGQPVAQRQLMPGDTITQWALGNLPGGLYLLEIRQPGKAPLLLRVMKVK